MYTKLHSMPDWQELLLLRYANDLPVGQIAALTGLSEKNVSVRLSRMRAKLKQYLIEMEVFV